jgi:hypothetical protein
MDTVGIFSGHVAYFTSIWYILWQFGIFCGNLVYFVAVCYILWLFGTYIFSCFGILYQENLATLFLWDGVCHSKYLPKMLVLPTYYRVTRLGKFVLIVFSLGSFLWLKKGLGYIFGEYFANAFGHTVNLWLHS